jgi:hypothetical protein
MKKEKNFHIPYYSKPINFVSGGFLYQTHIKSTRLMVMINTLKKKMGGCIVKELVTWNINVLISILFIIVERTIIHLIDAPIEKNLKY